MATLDGYNPYPINLNAKESVAAIQRAHVLEDTLKAYAHTTESTSAPTITSVYNQVEFWYDTSTGRLYRGAKNDSLNLVVWFEVD